MFSALAAEQVREIIDLLLKRVQTQLTEQQMTRSHRQRQGRPDEDGLRSGLRRAPMRRAIMVAIEDPLAEGLLHGTFQAGDKVVADAKDGEIVLEVKEREAPEPEPGRPPRRRRR